MRHFVHYLKREVFILDYRNSSDKWFEENQAEDQGFDVPSYHVTRAVTGPAARAEKGDTIWLFSQLCSPWGTMPPALDAKVIVSEISDHRSARSKDEPAFRFTAGQGSTWFPLFDATSCLAVLKTVDRRGKIRDLQSHPKQHVGAAMRSMRELVNPEAVEQLEGSIISAGFQFVSYRLADGTRPAFERCLQIVRDGSAVWWDRWSLPRRLAERREFLDNRKLDDHILAQIRKSSLVWGIESDLYANAGSYSLKEKNFALELRKYCRSP